MILQAVDINIEEAAAKAGYKHGVHYECRRYVDSYIVFAQNREICGKIYEITTECLSVFKLFLNETKLAMYDRPFVTAKSHITNLAKMKLNTLFDGITRIVGRWRNCS